MVVLSNLVPLGRSDGWLGTDLLGSLSLSFSSSINCSGGRGVALDGSHGNLADILAEGEVVSEAVVIKGRLGRRVLGLGLVSSECRFSSHSIVIRNTILVTDGLEQLLVDVAQVSGVARHAMSIIAVVISGLDVDIEVIWAPMCRAKTLDITSIHDFSLAFARGDIGIGRAVLHGVHSRL